MPDQKISNREKSMSASINFMMDQKLWLKILVGMALGVSVGLFLSPSGLSALPQDTAFALGEWLALPGVLFLGLIQMVIIPLVVCSIILGINESGSMDFLKQAGARIVPYFLVTTAISITIGVTLVQIIKPGLVIDQSLVEAAVASGATAGGMPAQTFSDLTIPQRIANMIPTNLAKAQLDKNMLQIVVASIIVGIALIAIPKPSGKAFRDLCMSGQILSMKVISWAMVIAPYAVFGLLSNITIRIGFDAIVGVGLYAITVLAGLILMMAVYLLIVKMIGNIKISDFLRGIKEVQLLAFSTSSSGATMPFTIQAAEEKLKLRPEVTRFVVPLGATINMDGTALYQAVAALFLCQVFGIDLSGAQIVLLILTTVGASIGTPATPGVGIVVLATILVGIGVPAEGIALIIGVDRILDMCRTTINVTGDLTATAVMDRWLPAKKNNKK